MTTISPRWKTFWKCTNGPTTRNNRWSVWTRNRSPCMPTCGQPRRRRRDGKPRRDNEYERRGTANVFCAVEPKAGRHFIFATPDRSGFEFAQVAVTLAMAYPEAKTIHLVMDNLNIHRRKSLTDLFGAEMAAKSGIALPSTTRPLTEVGSIRRKSKSGSSRGNVSAVDESPTSRVCAKKRKRGTAA